MSDKLLFHQKPSAVMEKPAQCDNYLSITVREEDELLTAENTCRERGKKRARSKTLPVLI